MAVYTYFGAMSAVVDEVATEGFRRLIDHVDAVATPTTRSTTCAGWRSPTATTPWRTGTCTP